MSDDNRGVAQDAERALAGLAETLRADVGRTADPQLKAMLETSAEAALGLHNAFAHYLRGDEAAWDRR